MCDAESKPFELNSQPKREDEKYNTLNKSVITKRKHLRSVRGYPPLETSPSWPKLKTTWFPKVNMYYAFNEDTNPFTRVSGLAKTVCNCPENIRPHFPPPTNPFTERDPYSEDEGRYKQLTTEPVCFAIFGKPDLNSKKLAKFIAEYWKCVLISPEILLNEEIEAKTDKGRWIKQVLRSGRSIGPEIILNLIESRLNGRDIRHRGYVVEGIPLIPNDPDLDYTAYPFEPSIHNSFTLEKMPSFTKEEVDHEKGGSGESQFEEYEGEIDEIMDEETSKSAESHGSHSSHSYDLARNPFATESLRMILRDDYQWDIGNQIQEMFDTWPLKPTIIIYMMCPDADAVHRRSQFRFDPHTGNTIDGGLVGIDRVSLKLSTEIDSFESLELDNEIINEEALIDEDFKKHLLTRVSNMRSNVEVQCKLFERYAMPKIDEQVLMHNPQHVIRVDGRTSAMCMFQIIRRKLRILALPRVILPKKMSNEDETFVGGEETPPSSVYDYFDGKSNEEAFQHLMQKSVIGSRYHWRLSEWKFTCPIALAKGERIEGSAKHAVRFMNKLYFLSSSEAMETFIENPRPFLLPPNPRPVCKIFIYGPKFSGKSNLAEVLAHTYGGKILDPQVIENREIEHRRNVLIRDAIDEILDDIIKELTKDLENQRQEREIARIAALESWHKEAQIVAEKLIRILENISIQKKDYEADEIADETEEKLVEIRTEIEQYNLLPLYIDHDLRDRILEDKNILIDFAPTELLTSEPPVRELDEQDPEVAAILIERTQEARGAIIELDDDDMSKLLAANINAAQSAPNLFAFKESGWIVNGMYPNVDLLEKTLKKGIKVEEIVVIHENEPYNYLTQKWLHHYRDELTQEEHEYNEAEIINYEMNESEVFQNSEVNLETMLSKSSMTTDSKNAALNKYLDELKHFEENWQKITAISEKIDAQFIDVDLSKNSSVESYVKQKIDDRYRLGATLMTDEEKYRETENANDSSAVEEFSDQEEEEEKDEVEETETTRTRTEPKDTRRLGDTGVFCPVALVLHHVLWKGKQELSVLFLDKIYLLSNQAALDSFLQNPREFVPLKKPMRSIPLLRVSIVGPTGCGKSTLAMAISKEYGLVHIDFPKRLDQYLRDRCIPLVGKKHEDVFAHDDKGLPTSDEPETGEELPEDLEDQRYNYDRATIQAFVRKYLKDGAALPKRMLKECLLDFFKPPYGSSGLIFDNFPASSHDAEAACDNFAVPELVVELLCSVEETQARIFPELYDAWKKKQDEKKTDEEIQYANDMQKIVEKRLQWVSKKMKERRRQRRAQLQSSTENEQNHEEEEHEEFKYQNSIINETSSAGIDSLLQNSSQLEFDDSGDSGMEEPDEIQAEIDLAELEEESKIKYKDPVKFMDWEDPDDARERIRQEIDAAHESSKKNLANARAIFEEQSIPWIELNAEINKTSLLISLLKVLDPYVFRNHSTLERVYEIDMDTADRLLDCGYYLLSSFGRSCPVQMYENKIPFQMFLLAEATEQVYPVLHRAYVYFLVGKERLAAFLEHPLKYLNQDSCTPLIPPRIAIIGPPKCGKSTLSNRFANTYGLKVITRGQALRHMLRDFSWTELAILTSTHLQGGHTALDESIARAVELHSIDSRSAGQGYILDGFPENQSEAEELAFLGIQPMIVIDLRADLDFCLSCLTADSESTIKFPTHSPCYLSHQYENWEIDAKNFRNWLSRYTQNVVTVNATAQKYSVWRQANEQVCLRFARIKKYFRESDYDKAQSLTYMCVSPYEFRQRQSKFESYCPACLIFDNILKFSGTPPSHEGMVQFREYYYWVCDIHLNQFLTDPLAMLALMDDITLPKFRAEIVDQKIDINHACWAKKLKVNGFCPVTYMDNLPRRNVVPGLNTHGVIFKENLYLFCTTECRDKFISQPTKYADVVINFRKTLPPVEIKNLPNLGFLEQTVAKLIVRAVNTVSGLRVKLPGINPAVTAAIYIGVYLKIHNKDNELNEIAIYEEVMRRMNARRYLLQVALRNAKKRINPYVSFPTEDGIIDPKIQTPSSSITSLKFRHDSSAQYFSLDEHNSTSSNCESFF